MYIAITIPSVPQISGNLFSYFCCQLIKELAILQPRHRFFIISDNPVTVDFNFPSNAEIIFLPSSEKLHIFSTFRQKIQLAKILKKKKTDLIFLMDGKCLKHTNLPQCILITDFQKLLPSCLKIAKSMMVLTAYGKNELMKHYNVSETRIQIIQPVADALFQPASSVERKQVKNKYTEGLDFFLCNEYLITHDDFLVLLKAFSIFKKRQKSNLKMLLLAENNPLFEKSLLNYKYNSDVCFVSRESIKEIALITAAAYAMILPSNQDLNIIPALEASQSEVPVSTVRDSAVADTFGDAVLCADKRGPNEIGEMMMRVYTDEQLRRQLIEKGKSVAETFTWHRTAGLIWQSLQSTLG